MKRNPDSIYNYPSTWCVIAAVLIAAYLILANFLPLLLFIALVVVVLYICYIPTWLLKKLIGEPPVKKGRTSRRLNRLPQ